MWKLIKMEFYRLFTSKALKVGALAALIICAANMFLSLGIVALGKLAETNDPELLANMSGLLSQVVWMYGVDFSVIVFSGTSALSLFIGCMVTASFIGSEQACGFTKNYAGQVHNKGYLALSKFIVTSIAQALVLLLYAAVSAGLGMALFGQYVTGYDIPGLLVALGLRLLLHLAINAIIVFICTLTKSHAVAMVVGCIFGIGITFFAYMAIGMLLNAMKITFTLGDYVPDGLNLGLTPASASEMATRVIAVALSYIVVFLAATYFIQRKRDIR